MADEVQAAKEGLRGLAKSAEASAKSLKQQRAEAERARSEFLDAGRSLLSAASSAGIGALARPGAGGADVAFGAAQGAAQGLPALGRALGSALGPLGALLGSGAGQLAGAGVERLVGPRAQAREAALAEVGALGASRAAVGIPLTDKQIEAAFAGAFERALRQTDFAARVRSQADLSAVLAPRAGR